MKIRAMFAAAGLVIAAMGVSTAADARPHDGWRDGRGWHDNGRHRGWENRRGGYRNHYRGRRCWTEYRHHRRIRVCR